MEPISVQNKDSCEKYLTKAKELLHQNELARRKKFDRIEIQDIDGNEIETCYNGEEVVSYVICVTNEKQPFHWGFCSKSCSFYQNADIHASAHQPYEEAKCIYFEEAPPGSDFGRNKGEK